MEFRLVVSRRLTFCSDPGLQFWIHHLVRNVNSTSINYKHDLVWTLEKLRLRTRQMRQKLSLIGNHSTVKYGCTYSQYSSLRPSKTCGGPFFLIKDLKFKVILKNTWNLQPLCFFFFSLLARTKWKRLIVGQGLGLIALGPSTLHTLAKKVVGWH